MDDKQTNTRVNVGLLMALDSLGLLRQIDALVVKYQEQETTFKRSASTSSSFYPKVHLLQCRDIDPAKLGELRRVWSEKKGYFYPVEHVFHISELQHSEDGKLLLVLRPPVYLAEWKDRLVTLVEPFRTKQVKQGKGGDEFFYSPPHISIGFEITPEDYTTIKTAFELGEFSGKVMFFQDLVMYEKKSEWAAEEQLEYF